MRSNHAMPFRQAIRPRACREAQGPELAEGERIRQLPDRSSCVSLERMRILILLASLAITQSALAEPSSVLDMAQQPEALRLIRTANEVYVFPVRVTENHRSEVTPHGDYKRARLLGPRPVESCGEFSVRRAIGFTVSTAHSE